MRRIMMTIGGTVVVLGSSLIAAGQDKGPAQAPAKAPAQAPAQAPSKAPMQAPQQKVAPVQAPTQAPTQKQTQAPTQSPVQKGGKQMASDTIVPDDQQFAMTRPGLFRRFR